MEPLSLLNGPQHPLASPADWNPGQWLESWTWLHRPVRPPHFNRSKLDPNRMTFPNADKAAPWMKSIVLLSCKNEVKKLYLPKWRRARAQSPGETACIKCFPWASASNVTSMISLLFQGHSSTRYPVTLQLLTKVLIYWACCPAASELRFTLHQLLCPHYQFQGFLPALPRSPCSQEPSTAATASACQGKQSGNRRLHN